MIFMTEFLIQEFMKQAQVLAKLLDLLDGVL